MYCEWIMHLNDIEKVNYSVSTLHAKENQEQCVCLRQIQNKYVRVKCHLIYRERCVNQCQLIKQMIQPMPTYETNDVTSIITNIWRLPIINNN